MKIQLPPPGDLVTTVPPETRDEDFYHIREELRQWSKGQRQHIIYCSGDMQITPFVQSPRWIDTLPPDTCPASASWALEVME